MDPPANLLGMSVCAPSHQLRVLRERGAASRESDGRIAHDRLVNKLLRELVRGSNDLTSLEAEL